MNTQEIRRKFINYFRENGHTHVPSSPILPHDDPTLLFINAGMNQFKDIFLGKSVRDYKRAVTSQKCIRVGGKHNDLENVGHTLRHLTFFEMLGNFSFGDYFKKEAIRFAWEVSTTVFELDPERIWPTVFREDDEAYEIWKEYVPEEKITRFDEKQNFWSMGDTGPCGPCSELLYDRGPKYGNAKTPLEDEKEERYMEFWNLVFMQYNRDEEGVMHPLPKPSIDTGSGLERVVSIKMDVESVYDTDVLRALITRVEEISGIGYDGADKEKAPAFRVIADHIRCLAFAIADGVQPSNVDRGYVLRKVLRRAVRYGRMLGLDRPFLADLVPLLIELMGSDYPELKQSENRIGEILTTEEENFIRTLRRGGNILNQIIDEAKKEHRQITGEEAFKLKDTYGFPLEEILLIALDDELEVDTKRFIELEEEAKERSRKTRKSTQQLASENLFEGFASCEFLGYEETEAEGKVAAIIVDNAFVDQLEAGQEGMIVLDRTPFYAEKGGQVGDKGLLTGENSLFHVSDCQSPYKGIIAHLGKLERGAIRLKDPLMARVDLERRQSIANHHTATHLLHWALCKVLGDHVKQAGSVVAPDRLRFDFSHHKGLTQKEIRDIEDLVNAKIRENIAVKSYELSYEEAIQREEIKQFFGDKYDNIVRVIDIDYSKELCGGTHVKQLGSIGLFRIAKEGSIAAGVRRIEAVTGSWAEQRSREEENLLLSIADSLKTQPQKLIQRINSLLEENKELAQELKTLKSAHLKNIVADLINKAEEVQGIRFIAQEVALSSDEMRQLADDAVNALESGVVVLAASLDGRCQLMARVSDDMIDKGIKASDLIKTLAPIIGGGGGGKAHFAQAGGKTPEKISQALSTVRTLLSS
ncbi:Alanyl-tRNA synthetase [Waddlia chondrophila 2032/99]|uniref:Alanine--tRNA ligase n=2 Tax=Waddlia chondrophila TaxID=71667 RepID=D6YTZ8_WADCW|nr:alanine--tRNA ligase [Waddlia chondrophila]ADI37609.1 Alanyl-tRNA synthetase [Waddlia chondrophila WSU 86-1044]CCB91043.1 Alanyl-tRNA synthetase [Waddlia chondrophila 2032/99]